MSHLINADDDKKEDPNSETSNSSTDDQKNAHNVSKVAVGAEHDAIWSLSEEKALMRKIDVRVPFILGALYAVGLIDRTNLSLGVLAGAGLSLELIGPHSHKRYQIALLSFFVTYIICDLPAQLLLKKVGPRYWLSSLGLLWGSIMLAQAFVKDYRQLALTRALCGAFEAGFFPGAVWLLSGWYTRQDVVLRVAHFWIMSVTAAGFAGILGWGFIQMDGLGGLAGWQWLWLNEGILTMVVAIAAFFIIDDFPAKAKWLTDRERLILIARLHRDRGDTLPEPLTLRIILAFCRDLKIAGFAIAFMCVTMPAYSFAFYAPLVLESFNYSINRTLLSNIPIHVVAGLWTLAIAFTSYKLNKRAPFIVFSTLISIAGLAMMLSPRKHVRLAGLYLGTAGCAADVVLVLAYQSSNVVGHNKKGFATGVMISFGGIGGLLASTVFLEKERPFYHTGLWVAMALQIVLLAVVTAMSFIFHLHNRQVLAGSRIIEGRVGYMYIL